MGPEMAESADAVVGAAEAAGVSDSTVANYRGSCAAVAAFFEQRGAGRLSVALVREFAAVQRERERRGEISPATRRAWVRSARLMLGYQASGQVSWRRTMSRDPGLAESSLDVLEQFAAAMTAAGLALGTVQNLTGDFRLFLAYLERAGRDPGAVTADDVRGFMVERAARRPSGTGDTVWALKRVFEFLNAAGLSDLRVGGLLAAAAPPRRRALPAFTRPEIRRLLAGIDTSTPLGKRDYAMAALAVWTGLRGCDIVALRLGDIDWRRDEITLVQSKTSRPLVLPLSPAAGNAVADWILHGRPQTSAPEVFVRLRRPFAKLGGSTTGANLLSRRLAQAGIEHAAHDGKSFHGLRRTTGTRLIETGAGQPLTAQILGHGRVDSALPYFALDIEHLRECCLPLDQFPCRKEGLR